MILRESIAAVRRFNRFYTQRIGILQDGWLQSSFSLTEARVLYEIAHRDKPIARDIMAALGLDAGYLSRILRRFQQRGLIRKESSSADGRRSHLSLTPKGHKAYAPLETHANAEVRAMLTALPAQAQSDIVAAMRRIEAVLHRESGETAAFVLRPPRPGDFGWIVSRHAILYGREHGWGEPFEGLCAQIVADFANKHDPRRERCWIAERQGENAGSIFWRRTLQTALRASGCCWSSPRRAASASARLWWTPASVLRARPATAALLCGRIRCSAPRAPSIRRRASR